MNVPTALVVICFTIMIGVVCWVAKDASGLICMAIPAVITIRAMNDASDRRSEPRGDGK